MNNMKRFLLTVVMVLSVFGGVERGFAEEIDLGDGYSKDLYNLSLKFHNN